MAFEQRTFSNIDSAGPENTDDSRNRYIRPILLTAPIRNPTAIRRLPHACPLPALYADYRPVNTGSERLLSEQTDVIPGDFPDNQAIWQAIAFAVNHVIDQCHACSPVRKHG